MRESFLLFKEYCRNVKEIGTVMPDSMACIDSLLDQAPFSTARAIVEFGTASGAVTREIIKRKRPATLFISFEKNKNLYRQLKGRVEGENVFLVNEDVFNCRNVLKDRFGLGEESVDCIVSTLPCSSIGFEALVRDTVVPLLKQTGHFVQYMHLLSLFKLYTPNKSLKAGFNFITSDLVWMNVPPVIVYKCRRGPGSTRGS